ncbi:MAG: alpha/beta fold hydrolase [Lentisphaerae bacterium]|nr:alpha/beta fold hydrolase [Lentisphaerota bacterium]
MKPRPILLIAGWGFKGDALRELGDSLTARGHAVERTSVLELGAAAEGAPADFLSPYAAGLLRRLGKDGESVAPVGWSMGGLVLLEAILEGKALVDRMILMSSTSSFVSPVGEGVPPANLRAMARGLKRNPEDIVRRFVADTFAPEILPSDRLAAEAQTVLASGVEELAEGLEYLRVADFRDRFGAIGLPTLVLHGTEDRIIPRKVAERLCSGLKADGPLWFEGAGHALPIQYPDRVAAAIDRFLQP